MIDPLETNIEETEPESEPVLGDSEEVVKIKGERPALTIVIQSWTTPIAALVMLIVGLVGGFILRPVVMPERQLITEVVNPSQPTAVVAAATPDTGEIMTVVTQQTKHFTGSEAAPVTIIEFSDYQ